MTKLDQEGRRKLMARFRPKNTKPEILVRKALHRAGRRFRLHSAALPGRPDIVMRRDRTVVMVHGCFWHAHEGCREARVPATRTEFWKAKFDANRRRDARDKEALENLGWRVIVIWECEAKDPPRLERRLRPVCDCGAEQGHPLPGDETSPGTHGMPAAAVARTDGRRRASACPVPIDHATPMRR